MTRESSQTSRLDLWLGVLAILIVSSSLALGANRMADSPLPLMRSLAKYRPGDLRLGQVRTKIEQGEAVLLDARHAYAYAEGHLVGALHLPPADFNTRYEELASSLKGKPLVVYCSNQFCPLADALKRNLEHKGHSPVSVFRAGYRAWIADGLPVERGDLELVD